MRTAIRAVEKAFGRRRVLGVPGFFLKGGEADGDRGRLSFTLVGDYALIPYHDREGRITTLEGRALTAAQARRTGKYVSLRGSSNHLYVYPRFSPDELSAFCEGSIGAIVSAQECGIAVGAVQGKRRYAAQGRDSAPNDAAAALRGGVLPELRGAEVVFGDGRRKRRLPYIPDRDVPDDLALETAKALADQVGALPGVVRTPGLGADAGARGADDLDGWLLSLAAEERRAALGDAVFLS